MAVTFLLKERNGFGGLAGRGGRAPVPREGGRDLPGPHRPAEGQLGETGTRARGACREPSSLPGDTHCTHVPISAPQLSVPHRARPGTSEDPHLGSAACRSLGERCCWVGAVGLTPIGGQLSQETWSCRGSLLPSGHWGHHPGGYGQGLLRAARRQPAAPGAGVC